MTLKDFHLTDDNHFVAMEYYMLILNRTYLVLITDDSLIGILANGIVSIESGGDIFSKHATRHLAICGDLTNPYSYIKDRYIRNAEYANLYDGTILKKSKSNFIIRKKDITCASYDPIKKWGMGYYPHDGKVLLSTNVGHKREFIILGNQSGEKIATLIMKK